MTILSNNFTLHEFLRSDTAIRLSIANVPTMEHIDNMRYLCNLVLQPIRDKFGPVTITSGYRTEALNRAVGGSASSDHIQGRAADITLAVDMKNVIQWISSNNLPVKQVIDYIDEKKMIHVSIEQMYARRQFLISKNGKLNLS